MNIFNWREEGSQIFGTIKRPVAEIFIKDTIGNWRPITLYIDSGADVTILRRSYGELLGLDVKKGPPAEFKGFGKGKINTFLHNLEMKIGNVIVYSKVAICNDDSVPNVLGRLNIFDNFKISFLNGKEKTSFKFALRK